MCNLYALLDAEKLLQIPVYELRLDQDGARDVFRDENTYAVQRVTAENARLHRKTEGGWFSVRVTEVAEGCALCSVTFAVRMRALYGMKWYEN